MGISRKSYCLILVVLGKKGSLTSHDSSDCTSTVSKPGAAHLHTATPPPHSLHVIAATPSDQSHGSDDNGDKLNSLELASHQYLTVLSKFLKNFSIFLCHESDFRVKVVCLSVCNIIS